MSASTPSPSPTPATPPTTVLPAAPSVAYYRQHPDLPAPSGHLFASVCWLVARHSVLHQLAARVPGAVDHSDDGDGDVLPWIVADAVNELDADRDAWTAYERSHPAPTGHGPQAEARYDAWVDAGPHPTDGAAALAVMSRTETARLRLLATLSDVPVRFHLGALDGFDAAGHDLITDWITAVETHQRPIARAAAAGAARLAHTRSQQAESTTSGTTSGSAR